MNPFLSSLPSAAIGGLGCFGAAAALLSYGGLGPLPAVLPALLVTAAAILLCRLSPSRQLAVMAVLLAAGLLLAFHWRTGLAHSAAALSYGYIDTLSAPYLLDWEKPYLTDPGMDGSDALTALLLALAWCFTAGSLSLPARFLCGALSLFLSFSGLYYAAEPPLYAVLLSGAYWLTIPAAALEKSRAAHGSLPAFLSALAVGAVIFLLVPAKSYEEPRPLQSLSDAIASVLDGAWFHGGSAFSSVLRGTEEKGRLGATEGIRFTGRNILRVTAQPPEHRLYLRSWVGSRYEDSQWHDLPESAYASTAALWEKNQGQWYDQSAWLMEIFAQDQGLAAGLNSYLQDPVPLTDRRRYFSVPLVYEDTKYLFLPYDISFAAPLFTYDRAPVSPEGRAYESYRWELPLSAASAYLTGDPQNEPYLNAYRRLEADYRAFVYAQYLTVPDGVLRPIAGQLSIPKAVTNEEKRQWIRTVQKYFQDYYTYTIRPGRTPAGEDFVTHFLYTSRRGYCTAFASAGTLLMRAAGIPARYVVGVTAGPEEWKQAEQTPEGYASLDLNDRHAHAWTEIYIDGIGWRPVEFTPGFAGSEDPIPTPPDHQGNPGENPPAPSDPPKSPQPEDTPQNDPARENQSQDDQPKGRTAQPPQQEKTLPPRGGAPLPQAPQPASIPWVPVLLVLLFLGSGAAWLRRRMTAAPRLFQRIEAGSSAGLLFPYLLGLTAWAGLPAPERSYEAWAKAAASDPRFAEMPALVSLLMAQRFRGQPLSSEERRAAVQYAAAIRGRILSGLSGMEKWKFLMGKH